MFKKLITINTIFGLMVISCLTLTVICAHLKESNDPFMGKETLSRIKKTGTIRMITEVNGNTYHLYKSTPSGFEYEMAKAFADYLDVELEVITPGWNRMFDFLEQGRGDFIAAGLTITEERKKIFTFSNPYMTVQQKLIHHNLPYDITDINDLEGKTIHVRRGTAYHTALEEIQRSGVNLEIILHDNTSTDELIRMVADHEIKFTVADTTIALLNRRYHPDIAIGLDISPEQPLGWAIGSNDIKFRETVNKFLEFAKNNGIQEKIHKKYYRNVESFDYLDMKKFHERIETHLPVYRETIKMESEKYGFDWRIIAAVAYQESHFNPWAKSSTGVLGIMQVTLETANEMGITNRLNPEQSLKAGIQYLDKLYQRFEDIEDNHQRLLFTLGSYNIGYGHIRDAQTLAMEMGLEKDRWHNMERTLPLLAKIRHYKNTQHGYARGWEPVHYVKNILTYYDILKKKA